MSVNFGKLLKASNFVRTLLRHVRTIGGGVHIPVTSLVHMRVRLWVICHLTCDIFAGAFNSSAICARLQCHFDHFDATSVVFSASSALHLCADFGVTD